MKTKLTVLYLYSVLILSGCATHDPYTGEEKTSNATSGAGLGAGIGLVLAYMGNKNKSSKERKKRMLQAAGIGAIVGGGVGYYMDKQESKLRKKLQGTGVSIQREGEHINLVMPGNITFKTNGRTLNSNFYSILDSVALVVIEYEKTQIVVSGYTDSVGSETYNQKLSIDRAISVADYLKSRKVNNSRFDIVGFGEHNPIANNKTAEGRSLNRRVEITLLPIVEK